MEEHKEQLLRSLKANPRYTDAMFKLERQTQRINTEEILMMNMVTQLEVQDETRAQVKAAMDLSKETVSWTKQYVRVSKRVAWWTALLAIATFALA